MKDKHSLWRISLLGNGLFFNVALSILRRENQGRRWDAEEENNLYKNWDKRKGEVT